MHNKRFIFYLGLTMVLTVSYAFAQEKNSGTHKKSEKELLHKGSVYLSPVPIFGVNPAFGFIYGAGASISWFLGEPGSAKISNALPGLAFFCFYQTLYL